MGCRPDQDYSQEDRRTERYRGRGHRGGRRYHADPSPRFRDPQEKTVHSRILQGNHQRGREEDRLQCHQKRIRCGHQTSYPGYGRHHQEDSRLQRIHGIRHRLPAPGRRVVQDAPGKGEHIGGLPGDPHGALRPRPVRSQGCGTPLQVQP